MQGNNTNPDTSSDQSKINKWVAKYLKNEQQVQPVEKIPLITRGYHVNTVDIKKRIRYLHLLNILCRKNDDEEYELKNRIKALTEKIEENIKNGITDNGELELKKNVFKTKHEWSCAQSDRIREEDYKDYNATKQDLNLAQRVNYMRYKDKNFLSRFIRYQEVFRHHENTYPELFQDSTIECNTLKKEFFTKKFIDRTTFEAEGGRMSKYTRLTRNSFSGISHAMEQRQRRFNKQYQTGYKHMYNYNITRSGYNTNNQMEAICHSEIFNNHRNWKYAQAIDRYRNVTFGVCLNNSGNSEKYKAHLAIRTKDSMRPERSLRNLSYKTTTKIFDQDPINCINNVLPKKHNTLVKSFCSTKNSIIVDYEPYLKALPMEQNGEFSKARITDPKKKTIINNSQNTERQI